jgi:hypothetical protein
VAVSNEGLEQGARTCSRRVGERESHGRSERCFAVIWGRKKIVLREVPQASPALPSDKSGVNVKESGLLRAMA